MEDYRRLDEDYRKRLEKVLDTLYYVPRIRRVRGIKLERGKYVWKVVVDGGGEEVIETWSKCVKLMPDGRLFIKDVSGRLYEVRSLAELDDRSAALLNMMI